MGDGVSASFEEFSGIKLDNEKDEVPKKSDLDIVEELMSNG